MKDANSFRAALASGRQMFLDGAMGTMLQASGMPPGTSPEVYCLANPDILRNIHKAYIEAGSNIVTTCTFGASPYKLPQGADAFDVSRALAKIAAEAAAASPQKVYVAGNIGPTGHFIKPLGDLMPLELINVYRRQVRGLVEGGADLIFMETQFDLAETRAAVVAARLECDLPIMASMTFENGLSLTGSDPQIFAETMQNMGVDVVGTNCSAGPVEMLPVVRALLSVCQTPVLAEPNAGMPLLENGQTVFPLNPEEYARLTAPFASLGCQILGGCCGTTPEHVRALVAAAKDAGYTPPHRPRRRGICLTSRSRLVRIGAGEPLAIIGERINPTGRKALAEQLRKGEYEEVLRMARSQVEAGASVLDINSGASLVDETRLLPELASLLVSAMQTPLSLDSSSMDAIEAGLPWYPASCLVNSISGETGRLERLGPLCKLYGAPFILLPLQGADLPIKAQSRIAILEKLLERAEGMNIPRNLVLVDILALAASSEPDAARESLKMASWCAREDLPTTIGLSNISFGLPARQLLNSVFLAMARAAGLDSCIANPEAPRIRQTFEAMAALLGEDRDAGRFIAAYADWQDGAAAANAGKEASKAANLYEIVLLGEKEEVEAQLEKELANGADPFALVNEVLIPAITEVGERYERKEYFLPQLIRSAETMRLGFDFLKPRLQSAAGNEQKPVIVMATVEGDIHDIGKNIVCLLLGNHGFEVIDAGKDVKASAIVDCAVKNGAPIIGLSALMTTTMVKMEETIRLIKERNLPIRVIVGGAAVTQDFADAIGADAYCADAVETVRVARKLVSENS